MTNVLKLAAQLEEVVHLAVVSEPNRLVLVRHWLLPGFRIDDRQAAMAQRHRVAPEKADAIRATVIDGRGHAVDLVCSQRLRPSNDSGYSTHRSLENASI